MLKVYKFLFPYFLRHKFSLLQYFLYLNVCAAFEFATPLLLGYFIDGLLTFTSLRSIVYFVVAFIAFQLVHILFRYLCTIKNALIQTQISLAVNSDTRKYIQELPLSYFNNKDLLYLSNRVDADSGVLASNAVFLLQTSWTVAAIFSLSLLYIIRVQPVLVVIVALMLVFYLVTFFIMRKKMYAHGYRHREVHSKLYSTLSEQILHYMIIKMFNLYKYYFNKFLSVSQDYLTRLIKKTKVNFLADHLDMITRILAQGGFFILSGRQVLLGNITLGQFITINGYFNNMTQFFAYFSSLKQIIIDTNISFDRIKDIYSAETDNDGDYIFDGEVHEIIVDNVSYALNQKTIINQFSASFKRGLTVIKGKNGVGKTTFSLALVGLLKDHMQGDIYFNGRTIRDINMADFRARYIGYCSQKPLLIRGTVNENILIPRNISEISPSNKITFPHLYNVLELDNGVVTEAQLSGGEKRKISLIRMIEGDLPINILDEPTNDLDIKSKQELIKYLKKAKGKKIIIVITHDEYLTSIADQVLTLESPERADIINIEALA